MLRRFTVVLTRCSVHKRTTSHTFGQIALELRPIFLGQSVDEFNDLLNRGAHA